MSALFCASLGVIITSCTPEKIDADYAVVNATVYTVDKDFSTTTGFAVKDGKILEVGSKEDLLKKYVCDSIIDVNGKFVYPGFIDGHCHFLGYGRTLFNVDLVGTTSKDDVIQKVSTFFGDSTSGWIQGRGWDQNDWHDASYPSKLDLDHIYPNAPVALRRVDGHALWVNSKALQMAGIEASTQVDGGEVMLGDDGAPNGILVDNAADLVLNIIPENIKERDQEALAKAQANCWAVGLTTVQDAGLPIDDILFMKDQASKGNLKMRVYQMASNDEETVVYFDKNGAIEEGRLTVNSFKCYMDGALGSRGALLSSPYTDHASNSGLQLTNDSSMEALVSIANRIGFQVNTHAIGDEGCKKTLNAYETVLKGGNDRRWRIEHSQVVDPSDIDRYASRNIIPSVQPTHATSDMYWAAERLGEDRVRTAYAYKDLLKSNGWLIAGSDFPVEHINPLYGFYAATVRKDQKGFPENGFQMENSLTREEALKAMTIWAAKGAFMEDLVGSIEPGKAADFVVLEEDLMSADDDRLFDIRVISTYLSGALVYTNKD